MKGVRVIILSEWESDRTERIQGSGCQSTLLSRIRDKKLLPHTIPHIKFVKILSMYRYRQFHLFIAPFIQKVDSSENKIFSPNPHLHCINFAPKLQSFTKSSPDSSTRLTE